MKRFHMAHFFAEEKIIYLLRITNYIIKIIINNYLSKLKFFTVSNGEPRLRAR